MRTVLWRGALGFALVLAGCGVQVTDTRIGRESVLQPVASADGGVDACIAACPIGCSAPGTVCYSDGQHHCSACAAACAGAVEVGCDTNPPQPDGGIDACVAACPIGCAAPGSICYSDGQHYCNACAAACSGATRQPCP